MVETAGLENGHPAAFRTDCAGRYLTFELGTEVYGIEILKVQEIIGNMCITNVPRTPDYVRGVINLRGKVIPVVELRVKFRMASVPDTQRTCIIVVQVKGADGPITMGVLVDEVSEVIDIAPGQLDQPPAFSANINTSYIMALGKIDARVVILLDVDKALSPEEAGSLERAAVE